MINHGVIDLIGANFHVITVQINQKGQFLLSCGTLTCKYFARCRLVKKGRVCGLVWIYRFAFLLIQPVLVENMQRIHFLIFTLSKFTFNSCNFNVVPLFGTFRLNFKGKLEQSIHHI